MEDFSVEDSSIEESYRCLRKKRSSAKRPHKRTPPRTPNVNVGDAFPLGGSCCEKNVHFCRVALPQRLATLKFGARGCQRPRWAHKDDERFFRKHRYPIHGRFPTLKGGAGRGDDGEGGEGGGRAGSGGPSTTRVSSMFFQTKHPTEAPRCSQGPSGQVALALQTSDTRPTPVPHDCAYPGGGGGQEGADGSAAATTEGLAQGRKGEGGMDGETEMGRVGVRHQLLCFAI